MFCPLIAVGVTVLSGEAAPIDDRVALSTPLVRLYVFSFPWSLACCLRVEGQGDRVLSRSDRDRRRDSSGYGPLYDGSVPSRPGGRSPDVCVGHRLVAEGSHGHHGERGHHVGGGRHRAYRAVGRAGGVDRESERSARRRGGAKLWGVRIDELPRPSHLSKRQSATRTTVL